MINLIVACGNNRVIGKNGRLPWTIPEDWDYFMNTTNGGSMIMGRTCYDEFAPHSHDREVIALTRDHTFRFPHAKTAHSLTHALSLAENEQIWICGGEALYQEAFPLASRLYLTLIEHDFEGDVFFPSWEKTFSKILTQRKVQTEEFTLEFLVLEKNE